VRAFVGQPLLVSSYPDTRSSSPRSGGVDLPTLLITAVASAAAAYACSKIWAPGTLASAAFTPVLVAIIKEALARPTRAVTNAVPIRGVVRGTQPVSRQPGAPEAPAPEPPLDRVSQPGEVTYHSTGEGPRRWRLAIVTGLLGFVVCVLVFTLPELLAGQSATGGGRSTTLFGGQESKRKQTKTTTAPAETVTAPAPTVTVPAPTQTTTAPATPTTTTTTPVDPTATSPPPTTTAPTVTEPPVAEP
jgi:hypothetical protein